MPSKSQWLTNVLDSLSVLSISDPTALLTTSDALLKSFHQALETSEETFLPSYTHSLPDGSESGSVVALDLGGSTLRVAAITLKARSKASGKQENLEDVVTFLHRQSWMVEDGVKRLPAAAFFDWIATRIGEVLQAAGEGKGGPGLRIGVTWSFPVEQTDPASGRLQKMGKGYMQWHEVGGTDLRSHFEAAFKRQGLALSMTALMNDTESTLLSHAYINPATRLSLIWGTGMNMAVYLPLNAFPPAKLGKRPRDWMRQASSVVVNTEVSMFGAEVFPACTADRELDRNALHPGYQPLEQMTSGRYLGEIFRLILVEGVTGENLFDGVMPGGIQQPFSLGTELMSLLESKSPSQGIQRFASQYSFATSSPPSDVDLGIASEIARAISARAALYMAVTIFTLWRLRQEASPREPMASFSSQGFSEAVSVAFCGAVGEKHPTALQSCQNALDVMMESYVPRSGCKQRLKLEHAADSGLLGAAVGAVVNTEKASRKGLSRL